MLRNLDAAGRGRMIENAGSEGMPLSCPTKGIALEPFLRWPGPTIRTTLVQSVLSLRACLNKIGGITVPKLTIEELGRRYACQLGHDDYPATDSCPYSRLKSSGLYTSYWNGWDAAGTEFWRDLRCADQVA